MILVGPRSFVGSGKYTYFIGNGMWKNFVLDFEKGFQDGRKIGNT